MPLGRNHGGRATNEIKSHFGQRSPSSGMDDLSTLEHRERIVPTERSMKTPGPDNPITVEPNPNRVTARLNGTVLAYTKDALTLREAKYSAVQ